MKVDTGVNTSAISMASSTVKEYKGSTSIVGTRNSGGNTFNYEEKSSFEYTEKSQSYGVIYSKGVPGANTSPLISGQKNDSESSLTPTGNNEEGSAGEANTGNNASPKEYGNFGENAKALARNLNVDVRRLHDKLSDLNKDFRLRLIEMLFDKMGFKVHQFDPSKKSDVDVEGDMAELTRQMLGGGAAAASGEGAEATPNTNISESPSASNAGSPSNVTTFSYEQTTEMSIEQSMSFSAKGVVKTQDGRSINIDLELNLSSSFYAKNVEKIEGKFVDPLVINFDAPAAALTQTKFAFDIDNNGTSDQISNLMQGSGFLALDKNEDGTVNNGSELFGTESGNGFADLAAYDNDKNGWIDESDDIYDKLRIFTVDEAGKQSLVALGEKGIGALYLGNAKADYALGSIANPDAMIRSTGVFLRENGTAGTMQHLDFKV